MALSRRERRQLRHRAAIDKKLRTYPSASINLDTAIPYLLSREPGSLLNVKHEAEVKLAELGSAPDLSRDEVRPGSTTVTGNMGNIARFIRQAHHADVDALQVLHAVATRQLKFAGLVK
jgi:hypothetical protein